MKTRVNLFSLDLLPPKVVPNLPQVTKYAVILTIVLGAVLAYIFMQANIHGKKATEIEAMRSSLAGQKMALEQKVALNVPKQSLVDSVDNLKNSILFLKEYLKEVKNSDKLVSKGYSSFLNEISAIADSKVWLTHFIINRNIYQFEGAGTSADNITRWISKLKQAQSLNGQLFKKIEMKRDKDSPPSFILTNYQDIDKEPEVKKEINKKKVVKKSTAVKPPVPYQNAPVRAPNPVPVPVARGAK